LRLEHLPKIRTLHDYQTALDRYLKQVTKINAVKAVFQFGRFGANSVPGLSDIDLVLVVDEKITHKEMSALSIHNLSEDDREIFLHDPVVVTEELSAIVFETTGVETFCVLYGEKSTLGIPETRSITYQNWALTLEYVPWYISCLQGWLAQGAVDVRLAIPVLRSVKYLLANNSDLETRFHSEWKDYSDSVKFLCDRWFTFSASQKVKILQSTMEKALKIVEDIAWARDAELTAAKQFTIERKIQKPICLTYCSKEKYVVEEEMPKNCQNDFYPLPPSCFLLLDVYQTTGGMLARFLNKSSFNSCSGLQPQTEFEMYLAKRATLYNEHIQFLHKKNVTFGNAVISFVFEPNALKNKSLNALSNFVFNPYVVKNKSLNTVLMSLLGLLEPFKGTIHY
jgi:hypothetical protein